MWLCEENPESEAITKSRNPVAQWKSESYGRTLEDQITHWDIPTARQTLCFSCINSACMTLYERRNLRCASAFARHGSAVTAFNSATDNFFPLLRAMLEERAVLSVLITQMPWCSGYRRPGSEAIFFIAVIFGWPRRWIRLKKWVATYVSLCNEWVIILRWWPQANTDRTATLSVALKWPRPRCSY